MRVPTAILRALVLLLIVRAVCAPLTVRPTKLGHLYRARVVVSVRTCWPPQRFERFSSTSKLLKLFQGKDKSEVEDAGRLLSGRPFSSPLTAVLGPHLLESVRTFVLDRAANSPRC